MASLIATHWLGTLTPAGVELALGEPGVLAGVEWVRPARARIHVRVRNGHGSWTPWILASVQGHDEDGPGRGAPVRWGEPIWTGAATALQIRADTTVAGVSVHVVSERVRARAAAHGRAAGERVASRRHPESLPLAQPTLPAGPGQPPIIAREVWAGHHHPVTPPSYGDVRMMFVHHSVNANGYSAGDVPAMLLAIYEFHVFTRGWNDIGYNFAVDRYGRIWEARAGGIDQAVVGAQAGGYNLESSGVVMLGTFASVLPPVVAQRALEHLLAWKLSLHGVPVAGRATVEVDPPDAYYTPFRRGQRVRLPRIAGHRDGCTTDCPGADLYAHLPGIRGNVGRLIGPRQPVLSLAVSSGHDAVAAGYLNLASVRVTAGTGVTLTGALREMSRAGRLGSPIPAVPVEIQARAGAGEEIAPGAGGPLTVVTDADGRFTVSLTPAQNMLVRALRADASAVASALVVIAVAPDVTLSVRGTTPLTLTGTVTPGPVRVELEAFHAAGAHTLAHRQIVDVAADGTFRLTPRLPPGSYWLRAIAVGGAETVAGESGRITVTV